VLLRQGETDGAGLAREIASWYDQRDRLPRMGAALAKLDHPDAAERIAEELLSLAGENIG